MTVYVDDVRLSYRQMVMCHMWADTLDELLEFADKIAVPRKHLQKPPHASWVHFDIALSKKKLAIKFGAVLTDKYGPMEHCANLEIATNEPVRVTRANAMLANIAKCRAFDRRIS